MSFFIEISLKLMCLTKYTTLPGPDPGFSVGGAWTHSGGGFGLQHGHFSVKMYVKTKELGPVGTRPL